MSAIDIFRSAKSLTSIASWISPFDETDSVNSAEEERRAVLALLRFSNEGAGPGSAKDTYLGAVGFKAIDRFYPHAEVRVLSNEPIISSWMKPYYYNATEVKITPMQVLWRASLGIDMDIIPPDANWQDLRTVKCEWASGMYQILHAAFRDKFPGMELFETKTTPMSNARITDLLTPPSPLRMASNALGRKWRHSSMGQLLSA